MLLLPKFYYLSFLAFLASCFAQPCLAQLENLNSRLLNASTTTIEADVELHSYMTTLAEQTLDKHCIACHGADLQGRIGVPDLRDYDWLWAITGFESANEQVSKITQTLLYGIRDLDCSEDVKRYGACPDTRFSQMPAYGVLGYGTEVVSDLTEYVIALSGGDADKEAVARGESFSAICAECHAEDGYGYKPFGGPNLRDDIWLFGSSKEQIYDVIYNGRAESCPAWAEVLEPVNIKALGVYLYNQSMGL